MQVRIFKANTRLQLHGSTFNVEQHVHKPWKAMKFVHEKYRRIFRTLILFTYFFIIHKWMWMIFVNSWISTYAERNGNEKNAMGLCFLRSLLEKFRCELPTSLERSRTHEDDATLHLRIVHCNVRGISRQIDKFSCVRIIFTSCTSWVRILTIFLSIFIIEKFNLRRGTLCLIPSCLSLIFHECIQRK